MLVDPRSQGGLAPGGVNFDAKVRRESFEPVDLFHAHIGGMDAFARGLKIAAADPQGRRAGGFRQAALRLVGRAASASEIESGQGRASTSWKPTCSTRATRRRNVSGRQEMLENIINRYLA